MRDVLTFFSNDVPNIYSRRLERVNDQCSRLHQTTVEKATATQITLTYFDTRIILFMSRLRQCRYLDTEKVNNEHR